LIIALTVAEGVDEGFSVWDWLVIAVGAVFIVQALFRLNKPLSAPLICCAAERPHSGACVSACAA
jgi:hypothetical protein